MAQLLRTEFEGRIWPLLKLSLWTSALTVLTLGFYRFWMKTRLRRHFWSAVRPAGTPLEYVGKGVEKFAGFLIALVILAFLIGIVALVLVYASFAIFNEEYEAYIVAALIALPLIYFAAYRAKRYVYARTRWRGIRFGLEPAAAKYALHAMGHLFLTLVTLGLLWPRMTFKLEKFRTDRTFFGDQRMHQGGKWTGLLKSFLPTLICVWVSAALVGYMLLREIANSWYDELALLPLIILLVCVGLFFYTRYRIVAVRYLANHKSAGGVGIISTLSFPRVLWITLAGYTFTNLLTVLSAFVLGAILSGLLILFYPALTDLGIFAAAGLSDGLDVAGSDLPSAEVTLFISIFLYMATLLFFSVFRQTFVLFPIWRHYASTLSLTGGEHFAHIRQRERDEAGQAEGMAEAFDLGAAI
ncbi:DUF898 domain-containing protein [Celeribacter litoreus]|uniref:DUF898 domain-containing protein n=1 Tax=Celeribacter litoreus TaxID=2876714 RepID=UPI001CCB5C51|nr:DUF898 domain-containing protein [Celeribacter litoreus]MCA0042391.1 DUF898 domain-containing protein [Celeribacter litoreus]